MSEPAQLPRAAAASTHAAPQSPAGLPDRGFAAHRAAIATLRGLSPVSIVTDTLLRDARLVKHFPIQAGIFGSRPLRAVDGVDVSSSRGERRRSCGGGRVGLREVHPCATPRRPDQANARRGPLRRPERDASAGRLGKGAAALRQIVFQDPYSSLNPRMTVGTIVERPLVIHRLGDRAGRAVAVASSFARSDSARPSRPATRTSSRAASASGSRSRGRSRPDRSWSWPTSRPRGLDVSVQAKILNLLKELQRSFGLTYVFISRHAGWSGRWPTGSRSYTSAASLSSP